jgi:hypothetical protein
MGGADFNIINCGIRTGISIAEAADPFYSFGQEPGAG